jgi:DNA-binding transcriptional LysR family regulator
MAEPVSLTTDQITAFVQLARQGSLRRAADELLISEQGLRNRLITLEQRLGASLYRKARGPRRGLLLTQAGERFLPHAIAFLERAAELSSIFSDTSGTREVNVVGSQYLITYVLLDAVREFHRDHPNIQVRLSARTERDIDHALRASTEYALGIAAPYEASTDLRYEHLFAMDWSVIVPRTHRLARRRTVRLRDLTSEPLIVYERGSTGRQHIIEAFQRQDLAPHVELEATTTDLVVRMVEAGLGVALVPLLPSGAVTAGRRVHLLKPLDAVRPIDSGLLFRKHENLSEAARTFVSFIKAAVARPRLAARQVRIRTARQLASRPAADRQ